MCHVCVLYMRMMHSGPGRRGYGRGAGRASNGPARPLPLPPPYPPLGLKYPPPFPPWSYLGGCKLSSDCNQCCRTSTWPREAPLSESTCINVIIVDNRQYCNRSPSKLCLLTDMVN